ncbi:MAG: HEAT repeat domain-containing protein [Pirellulales bacterium]
MSDRSNQLLLLLSQDEPTIELPLKEPAQFEWLRAADELELTTIMLALKHAGQKVSGAKRRILDRVINLVSVRLREDAEVPAEFAENVSHLYQDWGTDSPLRHLLLQWLTSIGTVEALELFAELIASDPPNTTSAAAVGFVPLLQQHDYNSDALFPRLLDGLQHVSVAVLILDLSNYLFRTGRIDPHPAGGKSEPMIELLGGIIQRLGTLEEKRDETTPEELAGLRTQVSEGVALAVGLCDALASIKEKKAIGKLYQAMELSHRQLRCEAAAALGRLGEEKGKEKLVELAQYPVSRLRVLNFAEELGCLDLIDPKFSSEQAKCEAELALWLSQDSQFGMPPQEIELVDSRELLWPGFEEPQHCYLFHYAYHMPQGIFKSLGIVGPITHSFAVDLTPLSYEDAYAAFAGWQTEHQDIHESDPTQWEEAQKQLAENFQSRLEAESITLIQPVKLGYFFGDVRLVVVAKQANIPGTAIVDLRTITFIPGGQTNRPIGPHEAYHIHKGRELLLNFNPNTYGV